MIGRTVDRFQVVAEIGRGGMGVVYKARDEALDRFVALKVLPPEREGDPRRRARFLQEAKAASALNHPGIVTVHDVRQVDGQDVLVMELVGGQTLERRMAGRSLPLAEALGYAAQIADAVGCAHAAGIVHRDLKPANVMVTDDGRVKVLDFGLAKTVELAFADEESPTRPLPSDAAITAAGQVVGTIAYMSPEQAGGRPLDARSDVFAFGVMLYEMLTGRHPFRHGSNLETLSAIRAATPEPPTRLRPDLPIEAERAVLRCLQANPRRRWQSLSDLGAVLEDLRTDTESARREPAGEPRRPARRRLRAATALLLVAALLGAAAWLWHGRRTPRRELPVLERLTYDSGFTSSAAISRDGTLVAYASDRGGADNLDLWIQHTLTRRPVRLTRSPEDDWQPSFSPDGSRIVFRSERDGGGIYVVDSLGTGERRLTEGGAWPRFSPDGSTIAFVEDAAWPLGLVRLFTVPAEGGTPRPLAPGFGAFQLPGNFGPVWAPDSRHVLFAGSSLAEPRTRDWWVVAAAGGPPVATGASSTLPARDAVQVPVAWTDEGLLYFEGTTFEGMNLFRAGIGSEAEHFRVSAPSERLSSGPGMSVEASVAASGKVVLSRFNWILNVAAVALDRASGRASGPVRMLTQDAAPKFGPELARDGRRVAYTTYAGTREERRTEIEVLELAGGARTVEVSTRSPRINLSPKLGSDGALLGWSDLVDRQPAALLLEPGASAGRELCRGCDLLALLQGEALVRTDSTHVDRLDLADGRRAPVVTVDSGTILDVAVSWDRRRLAVATGEPEGSAAISVVPLCDPPAGRAEWSLVKRSHRPLGAPRWSADGRFLYYLSEDDGFGCVWAQPLDPATSRPAGEPFVALHLHRLGRRLMTGPLGAYGMSVGPGLLVFNPAELTGNVYALQLPPR